MKLFGLSSYFLSKTISERSRQTGVDRTQVGEKAKRFVEKGMSLLSPLLQLGRKLNHLHHLLGQRLALGRQGLNQFATL